MRHLPISINNLHGDPTVQWTDTLSKVRSLSGHQGPVGVILKGLVSPSKAADLRAEMPKRLAVLVSASSLDQGAEVIPLETRLRTISNLREAGVPVIGYARPLGESGGKAFGLVQLLCQAGANSIIISGFRGTQELGDAVGVSNPSIRVKEMPRNSAQAAKQAAAEAGVPVFDRTACGVAWTTGLSSTWNPYWISPHTAGCATCPLRETCGTSLPDEKGMEVLKVLGYTLTPKSNEGECCSVQPSNRRSCPSCCTTCYLLKAGGFQLDRNDGQTPNLGDLAFARHLLGGSLVTHHGVVDGGDPRVGDVVPPNLVGPWARGRKVRALNTWLPLARQIEECFGCPYCITPHFGNPPGEYGVTPQELEALI